MREGKLVRDGVPALIAAEGREPRVRVLSEQDYEQALREKLLEEAHEAFCATDAASLVEELADVLEVLTALAGTAGASLRAVREAAENKAQARGRFTQRLFLEI